MRLLKKLTVPLVIVVGVSALASSAWAAGTVVGSRHDLRASGGGTPAGSGLLEVCVTCHTPHQAATASRAVAQGAGAESRRLLGTAMFSGMAGVTLFGLLLTPVFYVTVQALAQRLSSSKHKTDHMPTDQSSSGSHS